MNTRFSVCVRPATAPRAGMMILSLALLMVPSLQAALSGVEQVALERLLDSPGAHSDRRLKDGKSISAVRSIRNEAEAGDPSAQHRYGMMRLYGYGVKKDPAEGIRWLEIAAEQKDPEAQLDLGMCYARGNGVEQDAVKATRLFAAAAAAEIPSAEGLYNVAIGQEFGFGTTKQPWEARDSMVKAAELGCAPAEDETERRQYRRLSRAEFLNREAERGNAEAQFSLGYDLLTGREGAEKPREAAQWLRRAAEQGHAKAGIYYANLLEKSNPAEAARWYAKAAAAGDQEAKAKGLALKARERRHPIAKLEEAAARGNAEAQVELATIYYNGEGARVDLVKSLALTRKSVAQGNAMAQAYMGLFYYGGHGVEKDLGEAVIWWRQAAEQGVAMAQHNLGWALAKGWPGEKPHPEEAVEWYRKAANQGYGPSLHALGMAYKNGTGVSVDLKAAEFWLQTGVELGDPNSEAALALLKKEEKEKPAVATVQPMTTDEIEARLKGGATTAEIVADLRKRGFSGLVAASVLTELKKKGADAELLQELRRVVGPVVP